MDEHNDAYGEVIDVDGRPAVRFGRRYDTSRDDVWSAVTAKDRLALWAFPAEIEPRSGGSVTFDLGDGNDDAESRGRVITWDQPSVLDYEWGIETEAPWRVKVELADVDGGTELTFDHLQPDAANPEFAAGWHWHLDRLATHLGGTEPATVDSDDHFETLLAEYRTRMGRRPRLTDADAVRPGLDSGRAAPSAAT